MHQADISAAPSARHLPGPGPAGARPHFLHPAQNHEIERPRNLSAIS